MNLFSGRFLESSRMVRLNSPLPCADGPCAAVSLCLFAPFAKEAERMRGLAEKEPENIVRQTGKIICKGDCGKMTITIWAGLENFEEAGRQKWSLEEIFPC